MNTVLDTGRIRAICFDVDGTLSDTDDLWAQRLRSVLLPARFIFPGHEPGPFARWAVMGVETPGNLVYSLLDWMHLDDEVSILVNGLSRLRYREKPRQLLLIPGVDQMLKYLCTRYPLSVVSARGEQGTRVFLEHFGLSSFFQVVVSARTCEHTKPYPDPILYAARQMGVAPDECLMIGDTTVDMRAGVRAGAQTVGVLCGFGREKELRRAGAQVIIDTTAQLTEIL
jgi:phosphoglycolate phosphatase-like HAD superfamily hydrolase